MLATRFQRSAYGLNLVLRACAARGAMIGVLPTPALLSGLQGRIPDAQLADFERRIIRAGALDLGASPLDEAELGTMAADLARISAFDALAAGGAQPVPLRGRVAFVSMAATGTTAANGSTKRISSLAFDGTDHEPTVALAFLVVTEEMLTTGLEGADMLERELVKAAAGAADGVLVSALTAGTPATAASSGNFARDLATALAGMPDNSGARYFALVAPRTCRELATVDDGDGHLLFPDIDAALGGNAGSAVRVVPCSALAPAGSSDPDVIVVDASQVALGSTPMAVSLTTEASLQMSDSPTDAAASLVSMFQTHSTAFRAERSITAALVREAALAVITAARYESLGS